MALTTTATLQLVVIYVPLFNRVFDTLPLSIGDLVLAVLLASVVFAVVEIEKWLRRRRPGMLMSPSQSTAAVK